MLTIMKKMTFLACAAVLTSAIALTSCKSGENGPVDPQYDGEVVKTEFAIALPDELSGGPNKMKATTVQKEGAGQFQGITGLFIIPFAPLDTIEGADPRLGKNIKLDGNVNAGDIGKPSSARVYENVSVPITTGSFLLYGKSAYAGTKFQAGSLKADTAANTPADFEFSLEQIRTSAQIDSIMGDGKRGGLLMAYLTSVATAKDTMASGSKYWYQYPTTGDSLAMHNLFDTLTTYTHGLSSFEVERILSDLYRSLNPIRHTNAMANGVVKAINNATYATIENDSVKLVAGLKDFPTVDGLPEGALETKWNSGSHKFEAGTYTGERITDPSKYVYPAQLWYRVNSKIQTSNKSEKNTYDNTNNWATILGNHDDGASVNSRTRAIAIVHPIQYAVARLDVAVKLNAATLADNSNVVEGVATDVNCGSGFLVTAILVGGQKSVGFEFKPKGSTEYTIYDNVMANASMTATHTGFSAYNHTLVLENGNNDVMVAVEMVNSAADFYGVDNKLIPKGGKFYVVGKLQVAAPTVANFSGQVFKQDYITTANMTLNDLKHAYSTIPDLRTPKLEIGFSVDLTWQTGNTYNVTFD